MISDVCREAIKKIIDHADAEPSVYEAFDREIMNALIALGILQQALAEPPSSPRFAQKS